MAQSPKSPAPPPQWMKRRRSRISNGRHASSPSTVQGRLTQPVGSGDGGTPAATSQAVMLVGAISPKRTPPIEAAQLPGSQTCNQFGSLDLATTLHSSPADIAASTKKVLSIVDMITPEGSQPSRENSPKDSPKMAQGDQPLGEVSILPTASLGQSSLEQGNVHGMGHSFPAAENILGKRGRSTSSSSLSSLSPSMCLGPTFKKHKSALALTLELAATTIDPREKFNLLFRPTSKTRSSDILESGTVARAFLPFSCLPLHLQTKIWVTAFYQITAYKHNHTPQNPALVDHAFLPVLSPAKGFECHVRDKAVFLEGYREALDGQVECIAADCGCAARQELRIRVESGIPDLLHACFLSRRVVLEEWKKVLMGITESNGVAMKGDKKGKGKQETVVELRFPLMVQHIQGAIQDMKGKRWLWEGNVVAACDPCVDGKQLPEFEYAQEEFGGA